MIKVKPFNDCCITGQETKVWVEASDILYFSYKAYHVQTLMQLNDPFEYQEQKLCFKKTLYLCLTLENLQICNQVFFFFHTHFLPFQAMFRKAMVLYEMGQVDKSLQVFLQCLALDESFPSAKAHMEKVHRFGLCDALSALAQR